MGEPRYNGAFVPRDDEEVERAVAINMITGGFLSSLFPKLRPAGTPLPSAADDVEKPDWNAGGRYNGAYQTKLDFRTEQRLDKMATMHPVTKWIARAMEDPVACEKRLAAHFAFQEAATAKERLAKEQPVLGKDMGYWKSLRPIYDFHASAPAGNNSYKMHVLNMEMAQEAA